MNKAFLAYVNQDDVINPAYGTKQNPIPIFSFKGIKEPIQVSSHEPGSVNGYESLEPTQTEYEHNVLFYLKYIMTKEEFNVRFKSEK